MYIAVLKIVTSVNSSNFHRFFINSYRFNNELFIKISHSKSCRAKSFKYHFKSLDIYKELLGEKHIRVAESYNSIGINYYYKGEYDNSLQYYFKSLKITKELLGEKHTLVASLYHNLGDVYNKKREYVTALEYYGKAAKIHKELLREKHKYIAMLYNDFGDVYKDKTDYHTALEYYQKALCGNLYNFSDSINVLSNPVMQNYIDHEELLRSLQEKAGIFNTLANSDSLKFLSNLKNLTDSELKQLALQNYQLCDTLISQVRIEMKTKSDKIALGTKANEVYKAAVNICLQLYQQTNNQEYLHQAFYFSEKNKSSVLLEALAGSEALNFAGIPDTLLNLEHKLSIDITNYTNLKNNAKNDSLSNIWNSRLFKSQRSYDNLIIVFETQYPEYYNLKYNNSPTTVKQISNLLDKKTAILSYFVGDSTITIFAISKKDFIIKEVAIVETLHATSLHEAISDYRFVISETDLLEEEVFDGTHWSVDEYEKLAFQFYNLLFPPEIQEFLKGGLFYDIENLIIIPDGQLATIPFETFHTEKYVAEWTDWKSKTYFAEMPYLIKDYNISYSYSATLFQQTKPKEKTDKIELTPINDWIAFAPVFDDENTAGTITQTRELRHYRI